MLVVWKLPAQDSPDDTAHFAVFDTITAHFATINEGQDWTCRQDFIEDVNIDDTFDGCWKIRLLSHAPEIPETKEREEDPPDPNPKDTP